MSFPTPEKQRPSRSVCRARSLRLLRLQSCAHIRTHPFILTRIPLHCYGPRSRLRLRSVKRQFDRSDFSYQPPSCRAGVPHQQQHENRSQERNQPGHDNDRVENVRRRRLAKVRVKADQPEGDDRSDASRGSTHSADAGGLPAFKQVGRKHIRDRAECCVREGCQCEQCRDHVDIRSGDGRDQQQHPDSAKYYNRPPGRTQ